MMNRVACLAIFSGSAVAQWHEMPNGMYMHEECIHQFDDEFHVHLTSDGGSSVKFASGERANVELPQCQHKQRTAAEHLGHTNHSLEAETDLGYYSAWSVYAKTSRSKGYGYMSTKWAVPPAPSKRGPADQSSVYLFNGLEDGAGVTGASTLILQPVLQFGKSGCVVNPIHWGHWWLVSYLVVNGRAFCGSRLGPLNVGEDLIGEMTLTNPSDNTWRIDSTRVNTGEISTHSTTLNDLVIDAAYVVMEGMVIYNCQSFPMSGSIAFTDNVLKDRSGSSLWNPSWTKMTPKTECNQNVVVSGDTVTLEWDPTMMSENAVAV